MLLRESENVSLFVLNCQTAFSFGVLFHILLNEETKEIKKLEYSRSQKVKKL